MGERYYITGAQIGIIKVLLEEKPEEVNDVLKEIYDKQFIGDYNTLEEMAESMKSSIRKRKYKRHKK